MVILLFTVIELLSVREVPGLATRSLKEVIPDRLCTPAYEDPFVTLKVVEFVPATYPAAPGVLVKLPLKVMLTLFEFNTLLALISISPLRTRGLASNLRAA
jgi:hypothetical protein